MKLHSLVATMVIAVLAIGVSQSVKAEETAAGMPAKAQVSQTVYVCPDCHTMALKAGKCPTCQKEMQKSHVLGTKDGQAMLCDCGASCKCDAKGMKDGKCACGKDVRMISVKGMYVCPDGCAEVSDKPGKCMCGKEMTKVE